MSKTVKEIRSEIARLDSLEALAQCEFHQDERIGVQKALLQRRKALIKLEEEQDKYRQMLKFEDEILQNNSTAQICGIDEVGRGPLAGPVVACAVILNADHEYIGLNDSKKLSAKKRAFYEKELKAKLLDYAFGIANVEEIDKNNIYKATQIAMCRAVNQLRYRPSNLLVDAMTLPIDINQDALVKGDSKSISIAAASILAKEYRDRLMKELDTKYPGYDFANNVGYGTKKHLEGIDKLGITPVHRKTFEPIKSIIANSQN
ncbi:ribonuclease HII [Staphylococcus sp. SQ8-PEA]|uniref:Ribonuclease HII n=1 Tax=Staphylococcus marylandisciuri TaxID=2981529 RepID=A0ABT2QS15_9STAP|nr:ribonuclease HII [Staphylococcus marylandisciuri]MCU5746727.1 ribonuclease HII [Staphylococcus marylandisciuri]